MAPSEGARHELYNALIPLLGVEHTEILMAHLLPRSEMNERFDRVDERFDRMDERFDRMDERFDRMDERFDRLNERFNERFDRMFIAQIGGYTALAVAVFLN